MLPEEREEVRSLVVTYLQELVSNAGLGLQVSEITDDLYRNLNARVGRAELDWNWGIQFLNEEDHFDLAIGIRLDEAIDGIAIGVYREPLRTLEIQAIESFVRMDREHPLTGRMVQLTIIAATYFLLLVNGQNLHVIDPTDPRVIAHYVRHGLTAEVIGDMTRMVASVDELERRFDQLMDAVLTDDLA
ncbi:TPA: hypothetical protein MO340_004273 [Salmonella enterica subsp. salamae serovar 35:g,m,s,t:-]|nr:hypothetical protein [Salmonella enterica subsp. salamae serovar 35:g,m,s,t:-]HCA3549743.1 hypothetical protein [Salmonella enterica subsp. salamae serovar 35:g,m,s,t:-]